MGQVINRADAERQASVERSGSPQSPHPRLVLSPAEGATQAPARGIKFPISRQPYGYGGLYDNRDCSAMTRDLFAPFGLYLPRNSSEQARGGKVVPLLTGTKATE